MNSIQMRLLFLLLIIVLVFRHSGYAQQDDSHDLVFKDIPTRWDEGIPLGNGMLGALVWQNNGMLRISIDRADLWDLRPTKEIDKYTYEWAYQQKLKGDWDTVWKVADEPYDRDPAPTKLPGAAIEFDIRNLGNPKRVMLNLESAICTIEWKTGELFRICVDATQQAGWFQWLRISRDPILIQPGYSFEGSTGEEEGVVDGHDLRRLGYKPGTILHKKNQHIYIQPCWGTLKYEAAVTWKHTTDGVNGAFSISSHYSDSSKVVRASKITSQAIRHPFDKAILQHKQWWKSYWEKSAIRLPDFQLEKQWYLEMYKFGSASRKGSPPISLQAVWTADNGQLPPWKGDFHNDLNTQLSYWPSYSSNHLEEGSVYTDWLWANKPYFEAYTKRVFGVEGINVPGVATLTGREMGGWHMYAMSPTIGCWMAHHFYLQWRYSMDREFLENRAYPWIKGVATYLEALTRPMNGNRVLPMSSSPEFNDGGINAWFLEMTNYDIALCRFTFLKAAELSGEVGNTPESKHWEDLAEQLPDFDIDSLEGLTIAPGFPYDASHRHFSHLMAIHPLRLLNVDYPEDRSIMLNSLSNLEKHGTAWWCGYSFSWLGNLYALMKMGEKAADVLRTFSTCFCSPNSFHLNGDQCQAGHSKMTYRPFTLEGNFAFAAGIQEMLLQSHAGYIEVFPAIPGQWKDVSFRKLRAEGAYLVSASKENGMVSSVIIFSEMGGTAKLKLPFKTHFIRNADHANVVSSDKKYIEISFENGGWIEIENGYE